MDYNNERSLGSRIIKYTTGFELLYTLVIMHHISNNDDGRLFGMP